MLLRLAVQISSEGRTSSQTIRYVFAIIINTYLG